MRIYGNWTEADVAAHNAKVAADKRGAQLDAPSEGCEDESKLHQQIISECRQHGWIIFHGSMAHRAMRTPGEPDFTILADKGRVFFIECKTKIGKLTREQLGLKLWAENLGHKIHTVRSLKEFLLVIATAP